MLKIWNYNPGRPSARTPVLSIRGLDVFFSDGRAIAFRHGDELHCNETYYDAAASSDLLLLKTANESRVYYSIEEDFMNSLEDHFDMEVNNERR